MSEPTCRAQCYRGAGCLSSVRTYLLGTKLRWLLVKAVLAMSESTYRALCYRGAGCLSGVGTYLPGTVLQCCRLFKKCQNLPATLCVTVVKAVLAMSEPTCQALCYSGAGCLSIVRNYLPGTVLQGCRLYKRC